jgi:hypothetical protein
MQERCQKGKPFIDASFAVLTRNERFDWLAKWVVILGSHREGGRKKKGEKKKQ